MDTVNADKKGDKNPYFVRDLKKNSLQIFYQQSITYQMPNKNNRERWNYPLLCIGYKLPKIPSGSKIIIIFDIK